MTISFVVPDSLASVAAAAGITGKGEAFGPCALVVGDVICFPEAPTLFWQVTGRVLVAKKAPQQSEWQLLLAQAPDPLAH